MKLTILQEDLAKAINTVSRFSDSKAQLPVLGNILISTEKTKLLLSSTNLEIAITKSLGAKIEKEGKLTVPGKVAAEIFSNLRQGTINLEVEKEQLKITAENFTGSILGMNASDFPEVPQVKAKKAVLLDKGVFLNALSQVAFAASIDETRPVLTGILFILKKEKEKEQLILVGTDGFRLSQKKVSVKGIEKDLKIIIPKSTAGELTRVFQEEDEVSFSFGDENQVIFSAPDTVLSSRVIQGEFPDFERIIPKESLWSVILDRDEFLRAVKLSSVFARDSANIVKVKLGKDAIELSAESPQAGSQRTKVEAKVEGKGEAFEISFNYRFLEDFLHATNGEEIKIDLSDTTSPGVFRDTTDPDFLHLIMPVRIQV